MTCGFGCVLSLCPLVAFVCVITFIDFRLCLVLVFASGIFHRLERNVKLGRKEKMKVSDKLDEQVV